MDIQKLYSKGIKEYNAKNFDEALKIAKELQELAPSFRDGYYLEAIIWNKRAKPVKEFYTLKRLLPVLNFSSAKERNFASEILKNLGAICGNLSLYKESYKLHRLGANLTENKLIEFIPINNAIFVANFSEEFSSTDFHECYKEYKKCLEKMGIRPFPKQFYNHEKIRIGFLSADFHKNAMVYWAWSLLTRLNKNLFETYFYSNSKTSDNVTNHLRSIADGWRNIHDLSDEEAAKVIRGDEIDILFDLSGYVPGNRLCSAAYRPASVQMSGIGYMNSTGLDCFDYFLSDVYCAGNAAVMKEYFTEKIIKMPHSHICYEFPSNIEPAPAPPCLKNGFVTFGCFNKFNKITDTMFNAWKKILDAVPNSRLILKHLIFKKDDLKIFVEKRLKTLGFDLSRIEMRPFSSDYLEQYADVDIALDTFSYTGGVTTCEALYMGVPVISLYGDRHGTRFGLSILSNIGIDELAVDSYDEYIKRATALASDWELLTILRKNLRTMMEKSPLMDAKGYIRDIEKVFIKILNDEREKFLRERI